ncbi:MAG: class I SAM-dependent methyltransferase, partial [Burkholderiales bacterium]|nr:class I SAM-dependent methyltransferase [Burkholderiales bacterium]
MDARELLRRVLAVCGPGRLLVSGPRAAEVVAEARKSGVDALPLPAKGRAPGAETVLLTGALGAMPEAEARAALVRAAAAAGRSVVLSATDTGTDPATPRAAWERLAFAHGLRRHPLFLLASPYPDMEYERAFVAALEKVPAPALARWPLEALARERDLHMDMLREAGRRSDAHAERYRLAMAFARRGDAALDAACGLGYGSRLLFEGSGVARVTGIDVDAGAVEYARGCYGIPGRVEYRQGDATDLSFLGAASVDFVASFETLEHLLEPERFLAEVARVLRPSGRLVVSVPNRWVDETGRDPNPHHHHVYDWPRLRGELARHFIVERAFVQTAGGGMVHAGRSRSLAEFAPEGEAPEGEWILAVAMQDPAKGRGAPYEETVHAGYGGEGTPAVVDFARAYANPWLVRGMVNTGTRLAHRGALLDLAGRVASESPAGSVDAGAALCVALYGALERGKADAIAAAATRARQWRAAAGDGPHALRWRVSLLHAEGLAALVAGDRPAARRLFAACAATDVSPFSPLLATKRVASAWFAGLLDAQAGDAAAAAAAWREGL